MEKRRWIASALFLGSLWLAAESPAPVIRLPGHQDRPLSAADLTGSERRDVRIEDGKGGATVYRGLPLLDVLEKNGLDVKDMSAERKTAPAVVIATSRDGYTVVFSVGELAMHRGDPRVYLVSGKGDGPLSDDEGPVRLVVVGQRARSAYGLSRVEVKYLADNPASGKR